MEVIEMEAVAFWSQYRSEGTTSRAPHVTQYASLTPVIPTFQQSNRFTVLQTESRNVDRAAFAMLGNARARLAVACPTSVMGRYTKLRDTPACVAHRWDGTVANPPTERLSGSAIHGRCG